MNVLKKIEKAGEKGIYARPYPGFSNTESTAYTLVHFPTFRRKVINRHNPDRDDFDTIVWTMVLLISPYSIIMRILIPSLPGLCDRSAHTMSICRRSRETPLIGC